MEFEDLFRDTSLNMVLTWILTIVIGLVFVESFLELDFLWFGFTAFLLSILLIPPIYYRNRYSVLPWELVFIAAIPVIVRVFDISLFASQVATYIAFAAVALIIAVELHIFTSLKFNHAFSVVFVVVSTLAVGAVWSVIRFYMDIVFGTGYLTTNDALMQEWTNIFLAGIFAGLIFDIYFTKRDNLLRKGLSKVVRR